jgi:1-deoxy-D-xylulose-5-phosphate synthase
MDFHQYQDPKDLSILNFNDLPQFCEDLRAYIIETILNSGGHFAANLGVVELCVTLMKAYPVPQHRYIWDVGHQSYPFKILTHRKQQIKHIRTYDGISGFPKLTESTYDSFGTGHSSTAISAAMGMAWAQFDLPPSQQHTVISIVGDGALTGGMSFEALNNLKSNPLDVLIVFNDNGMGIDPNAGAIHQANAAELQSWFEFFGLHYIGPVNGHDIAELTTAIHSIQAVKGPKLLHVKTIKGKGYAPAEIEQTKWHSAPKYVKVQPHSSPKRAWHEAFGDAMFDLATKHPKVMGITPAMPSSSGLSKAINAFPERFVDVTIAEQHALTFAAGIAQAGKKPFVAIYSTFLQRAYDQFIHDIALQELPVTVCIDRAGLVGEDGPTHHGAFDLAFLLPIPNIQIWSPANENELVYALNESLNHPQPVCIRYPKGPLPAIETTFTQPLTWLKQLSDSRILCITTGKTTELLGEIEEHLEPLFVDWLHLARLKPLPPITNLASYTQIITIEDGIITGGIGNFLKQELGPQTPAQWHHLGINDTFITHGNNSILYELAGYGPKAILKRLQDLSAT